MLPLFTHSYDIEGTTYHIVANIDPSPADPRKTRYTHITVTVGSIEHHFNDDQQFIGNIIAWIMEQLPSSVDRLDIVRKLNTAYKRLNLPISTSHPFLEE